MTSKVILGDRGGILSRLVFVPSFRVLPANNFACIFKVDKRAHHNALERKRRDHIKDSFSGLRDSVPSLQGEKVSLIVSRITL